MLRQTKLKKLQGSVRVHVRFRIQLTARGSEQENYLHISTPHCNPLAECVCVCARVRQGLLRGNARHMK